jgi:predicted nucleic acid-binding Zn ribbon protein
MTEPPASEMKKCPYCGKMTSTKANFCYYCARELVARPERPSEEAKPAPINWRLVAILAVVVMVLVYVIFFLPR